MVRSKVNYNMNAIPEPPEPMGEDRTYNTAHLETVKSILNSERYILIQNEIYVIPSFSKT